MDRLRSFSSISSSSSSVDNKQQCESFGENDDVGDLWSLQLPQILEDVDRFLNLNDKDVPNPIPECVMLLPKLLDSIIMDKYNTNKPGRNKFGQNPEDDKSFLDVIDCISRLSTTLNLSGPCLDKTTYVLEKAMSILEDDLCSLLHDPKHYLKSKRKKLPPKKSTSFGSLQFLFQLHDEISDGKDLNQEDKRANNENEDNDEDLLSFSTEQISILNKISNAMINTGFQTECCMTFSNLRRNAFQTALQKLGYTNLRMEEVYRMQWESMEGEIVKWNNVVRHCTTALFNVERKLYEYVFPNQPSISQGLFCDLTRVVIVRFLNFSQVVVLTKPSPEKLFKMLDMYETLRDNVESIVNVDDEVAHEIVVAKDRIIEAIMAMFCDLENSIKSDSERMMVPYGVVHPMTRYIMNYLKYACEYKQTLEQIFLHSLDKGIIGIVQDEKKPEEEEAEIENGTPEKSPFAVQLMTIMDLLDVNIERKSKLYKDPSLCYVFLMNNGRYIVQKTKGCLELHECVGDNWCRRKQSSLRLYHKSYQRETWGKVLKCLNLEGLQVSGNKVSKQVLKERFKYFNSMFEEIHKTQSSWMVSDEQLQSELRVSISALVIPAYRSFLGRFKHHLESSRHIDRYIKYHPEDIEALIDDFFAGNAMSMSRKRT